MNPNDFFTDKLPDDVQRLFDRYDAKSADIRETAEREAAAIREKADEEAAKITTRADDKLQALTQELLEKIKPLVNKYAKEGMLDEALTIRERIRSMRGAAFNVQPDPGHVHGSESDYGKSFLYDVTGTTDGSVYGTDVYTCDASLAAAAVHAGALKDGERGIVRVTILDKPYPKFTPSTRNGITSLAWTSSYPAFRVAKA